MADDLLDILQLRAWLCQQAMIDLESEAANNREAIFAHQVIDLSHRAIGAVFNGQYTIAAKAISSVL